MVSEIGDHLRKALLDITTDVVGAAAGGEQEKPIARLQAHLSDRSLSERVVLVQLTELARVVLRLDHRLNHLRDEVGKAQPAPTWDEVRRAVFVTALVAYELSRVPTIRSRCRSRVPRTGERTRSAVGARGLAGAITCGVRVGGAPTGASGQRPRNQERNFPGGR